MSAPTSRETEKEKACDLQNTFCREFEKNSGDTLTIHQLQVGDVGCVVWDAALVLSKYLETQDFDCGKMLKDKQVLELGAGTGIVGLAAASLGSEYVCII